MKIEITTDSKEKTVLIGRKLGEAMSAPNDVRSYIITLDGDLGAGKTAFTGGLAQGLGIDQPALSPSFTIVKEYHGSRLTLYHIDLYRLNDVSDLSSFDFYEYAGSADSVTAIEWANKFGDLKYLPDSPRIEIFIETDEDDPENKRKFKFDFGQSCADLASVLGSLAK